MERKLKDKESLFASSSSSLADDKDGILQFYCEPLLNFSSGEVILPLRLTCYCRHHREHKGFQIRVSLLHPKTKEIVASASSSLVMITDDRKSQKKRLAETEEGESMALEPLSEKVKPKHVIERVIPTEGPVAGGIEVTVLGNGFHSGLRCLFGDNEAPKTQLWGDATLIATLPPALHAGPVNVTLRDMRQPHKLIPNTKEVLFTYTNDSNKQLFELALQVIGMKLTGRIENPTAIAMNIVASSQDGKPAPDEQQDSKSPTGPRHFNLVSANNQDINEGVIELHAPVINQPPRKRDKPLDQLIIVKAIMDAARIRTDHPLNLAIQNKRGHNLLHLAVANNYIKIVDTIASLSDNEGVTGLNAQDHNGWTPLHFAAFHGHSSLVASLLKFGASSQLNNENGDCPRDVARNVAVLQVFNSYTPPTTTTRTTSTSSTVASSTHSMNEGREETAVDLFCSTDVFEPMDNNIDAMTTNTPNTKTTNATAATTTDPLTSLLQSLASFEGSFTDLDAFSTGTEGGEGGEEKPSSTASSKTTQYSIFILLATWVWSLLQTFWSDYRVFLYIALLATSGSWSLINYVSSSAAISHEEISYEKGLKPITGICNPPSLVCGSPDFVPSAPVPIIEVKSYEVLQLDPIKTTESYVLSFGQFAIFLATLLLVLYHYKKVMSSTSYWLSNCFVFVCLGIGCLFIFDIV